MQPESKQPTSHAPRHARSSLEVDVGQYSRNATRYSAYNRNRSRSKASSLEAREQRLRGSETQRISSSSRAAASRTSRARSSRRGAHAAPHGGLRLKDRFCNISVGKRVALGLAAFIALVLLACIGFGAWFTIALDAELASGSEEDASASEALTAAKPGEPFYILVMGSDSREGSTATKEGREQGDNQRSDVMMLVRVDVSGKQLTIVSVPRDTPYMLDTGEKVKINELYNRGGAKLAIEGVSEVTGENISHYAAVHFSELASIVDALGGVTVNVEIQLSYKDALTGETITLEPGMQTLNGQQAQIFARARHEYGSENQDAHRQNNVRQLAVAILDKATDKPLVELPETVLTLASCLGTDMRTADILSIAPMLFGGIDEITIYSCSGPSDGELDEETGLWLCYENPEAWQAIMDAVDAGEDPTNIASQY